MGLDSSQTSSWKWKARCNEVVCDCHFKQRSHQHSQLQLQTCDLVHKISPPPKITKLLCVFKSWQRLLIISDLWLASSLITMQLPKQICMWVLVRVLEPSTQNDIVVMSWTLCTCAANRHSENIFKQHDNQNSGVWISIGHVSNYHSIVVLILSAIFGLFSDPSY